MPNFRVWFETVASSSIVISAPDKEAAQEIADTQFFENVPEICGQCGGWGREIGIDLGDWESTKEDPEETDEEVSFATED